MATRTTNYSLYMPDPTDPFEEFRAEHNENMKTIDKNLGGGGGGGSGSEVTWTQLQQSGTKIAEITIDGTTQDVYAPSSGGGGGGGGESIVHIYAMVGSDRNRISETINYVIT